MVGQLALDQHIGVRLPVSQPRRRAERLGANGRGPRSAIVADVNCDNFLRFAPVRDIIGAAGNDSTLDLDFIAAAKELGIEPSDALKIAQPLLVLSDHFSFLNQGIPAVSIFNGNTSGDGKRSGAEIWTEYFRNVHHTPHDNIDQAIDWTAAVTETRFAFLLLRYIATDQERPRLGTNAFFAPGTTVEANP